MHACNRTKLHPDAASREISSSELSSANLPNKGWVAIRGKVYDLTDFATRHPGGRAMILTAFGRDCTIAFEMSHSDLIARSLQKYYIGQLTDYELPHFPTRSDFGKQLNKRIEEYFFKTKQDPKHAPWMVVRYAVVLAFLAITYGLTFISPSSSPSLPLQLTSSILFGLALSQLAVHFIHDGSHGSFTRSPIVWQMMASLHDFLNGCSSLNWHYQHVLGHHIYTNVDGADPDIAVNSNDFRRIRPWQKWSNKYTKQFIYAPIIYCFLAQKIRVADYINIYKLRRNSTIRINPLTLTQHAVFWGGKAFFLLYRFAVPYFLTTLTFGRIIALNIIIDFTTSWTLALIFQANHVVDAVSWPQPSETGLLPADWARMQVETAQDYAHDSWLARMLTGSLNFQVVHHLFPHHSQFYYPEMAHIIKEVCIEHGIVYQVKSSLWEAFGGHIGLLKHLASGEAA